MRAVQEEEAEGEAASASTDTTAMAALGAMTAGQALSHALHSNPSCQQLGRGSRVKCRVKDTPYPLTKTPKPYKCALLLN